MDEHLNCKELEVRLNELLDQRLEPDQDIAVNAHIEFCPECHELVRSHALVQKCLDDSQSSIDELDVDVSNSVVNNWAHLFPEPKTKAWQTSSLVIIICLLILLPIGLIWISWPKKPVAKNDPPPSVNADIDPSSKPADSDSNAEPVDVTMNSLQDIIGTADDQLKWLDPYRPTMQLFGVSTMFESLDFTIDLLMDQLPNEEKSGDPSIQNPKSEKDSSGNQATSQS